MNKGYFYFLKDIYSDKYSFKGVMPNKPQDNDGNVHGRPYYYSMQDDENPQIMWMIPISSKVEKYQRICDEKFNKYHRKYDGIAFGNIRGQKRAFLVQNMCPVISQYIDDTYLDSNTNLPIVLSEKTAFYIESKAKKMINLSKRGKRCTLTDIPYIYNEILKELDNEEQK